MRLDVPIIIEDTSDEERSSSGAEGTHTRKEPRSPGSARSKASHVTVMTPVLNSGPLTPVHQLSEITYEGPED